MVYRDQKMSRGKHEDWNCDKRHPSAIKKMTCYNVFIRAISDFPSDGSYRRTQHLSNLLDFSLDIRRLRHLKNPHMLCWSKLLWDLRNRAICLWLALWHMLNLISELKRNQTGINKKRTKTVKNIETYREEGGRGTIDTSKVLFAYRKDDFVQATFWSMFHTHRLHYLLLLIESQ